MNNYQIYELARNINFGKLIEVGIVAAATSISGEAPEGKTEMQLEKRHKLATLVLNNPTQNILKFAIASATQAGLNSVITIEEDGSLTYTGAGTIDDDVAFTVASIWDDIAGVKYSETL